MSAYNQLRDIIQSPKKVMIVAHRNPDGDAIGSVLALGRFLKIMGHEVHMVLPSEYPSFFSWLPNIKEIMIYDRSKHAVNTTLEDIDVFFILDLNSLNRLDELGERIREVEGTRIAIDHHLEPREEDFDLLYSNIDASSTCELLFEILSELGPDVLDNTILESLYLGILTDTGTFSYSTSPRLFKNVAKMLEIGSFDHIGIQYRINNNVPEKNLRLLGFCLNQRMEILAEDGVGIIHLTSDDFNRWKIKRGDTEGIVNHILKIKNIRLAAFFTDQRSIIKISLRSYGDLSVADIARDHFNGGGHKNAAGGHSTDTLEATMAKFKEVYPTYL